METNLSDDARRLLAAMATAPRRASDAAILRAAGMTREEGLRAGHAARVALGVDATVSLRDIARNMISSLVH
jgi:hypothetical protein